MLGKKILKIGFLVLIVIVCLQFITYSLFAKKSLVSQIGNHFETFILTSDNGFEEVMLGANVPLEKDKVIASFSTFEKYIVTLCEQLPEKCIEDYDWNKKGRYQYFFEMKNEGAFAIHTIAEFEHAPEYVAVWESLYVWVIFRWMLITKESKGMS